ncbi:GNAT family N-acetyltransferase [Streptomyces sp. HSW2009]|uniref:GNAT family N-acetyltransferase n=1 Tax=Streptomyces sp. HSW2009 TaxID=3142890 RepID=UPI0032EBF330
MTQRQAADVAALVGAAYARSDPLPGLPVPDGAHENPLSVREFTRSGGCIWVGRDPSSGTLVAALRTELQADGGLFVSRISAPPDHRGGDVGARLLAAVEDHAVGRGVPVVRLTAVVERCLPTYYTRLGYHTVQHHLAVDDKLLTEVTLERTPGTPRRVLPPYPFDVPDAALRRAGPFGPVTGVLCWFLTPGGLAAVAGRGPVAALAADGARALPGARLAGIDLWRGPAADWPAVLDLPPGEPGPAGAQLVHRTGADRAGHPTHLMPRTTHRDLWAALRMRPGHESGPTGPAPDLR